MKKIEISIIVPVYKVEKYLAQCIESILVQSFEDFELLLIDDGSPDNSGTICDAYAKRDSRLHVVHKQNEGTSAARNLGIAQSKGEWLTFIDADDWVDKNFLLHLLTLAVEKGAQITGCALAPVVKGKIKRGRTGISCYGDTLKKRMIMGEGWSCAKLFKKELFTKNSIIYPLGISYCEDLAILPRLASQAEEIAFVDEDLYFYRQHAEAATFGVSRRMNDLFKVLELLKNTMNKAYGEELEFVAIERCKLYFFLFGRKLKFNGQAYKSVDFLNKNFPKWKQNSYYSKTSSFKNLLFAWNLHRFWFLLALCSEIRNRIKR